MLPEKLLIKADALYQLLDSSEVWMLLSQLIRHFNRAVVNQEDFSLDFNILVNGDEELSKQAALRLVVLGFDLLSLDDPSAEPVELECTFLRQSSYLIKELVLLIHLFSHQLDDLSKPSIDFSPLLPIQRRRLCLQDFVELLELSLALLPREECCLEVSVTYILKVFASFHLSIISTLLSLVLIVLKVEQQNTC